MVKKASFDEMKKEADELLPEFEIGIAKGAKSFINKGTNDRWRNVLTAEELLHTTQPCAARCRPTARGGSSTACGRRSQDDVIPRAGATLRRATLVSRSARYRRRNGTRCRSSHVPCRRRSSVA